MMEWQRWLLDTPLGRVMGRVVLWHNRYMVEWYESASPWERRVVHGLDRLCGWMAIAVTAFSTLILLLVAALLLAAALGLMR